MYKFARKAVEEHNPHYDPDTLLDTLMRLLRVRNDRQLATRLGALPSQICKIRKRQLSVSATLLISMHEETDLSFRQLRALMGDYRDNTGPKSAHPVMPQLQYLKALTSANAPGSSA